MDNVAGAAGDQARARSVRAVIADDDHGALVAGAAKFGDGGRRVDRRTTRSRNEYVGWLVLGEADERGVERGCAAYGNPVAQKHAQRGGEVGDIRGGACNDKDVMRQVLPRAPPPARTFYGYLRRLRAIGATVPRPGTMRVASQRGCLRHFVAGAAGVTVPIY